MSTGGRRRNRHSSRLSRSVYLQSLCVALVCLPAACYTLSLVCCLHSSRNLLRGAVVLGHLPSDCLPTAAAEDLPRVNTLLRSAPSRLVAPLVFGRPLVADITADSIASRRPPNRWDPGNAAIPGGLCVCPPRLARVDFSQYRLRLGRREQASGRRGCRDGELRHAGYGPPPLPPAWVPERCVSVRACNA